MVSFHWSAIRKLLLRNHDRLFFFFLPYFNSGILKWHIFYLLVWFLFSGAVLWKISFF